MIALQNPTLEIRITLAGLSLAASIPDRVALQALALCLAWPSPPWEEEARLELERASQEERESRQFLQVARPEEKTAARQGLFAARSQLQVAQERMDALRFPLRDVHADARLAMARLQAAGVPASTWSLIGQQLLAAWVAEILPAPESEVTRTLDFTLPPQGATSGGGSSLPGTLPAMPSDGTA